MSLGDATDDLAGQDVKGGIQTGRAVALVVMRPALDLPGLERQHGLGAIQRLDLCFFVHREHQRVVGRIQVQPDHIDHFVGKVRVVADLEGFQPVGLEVGGCPHLGDLPDGDPGVLGHQPQAPVGGLTGYPLGRQAQDFLDLRLVELARLSTARQIIQPLKAGFLIALAPFEDHRCGDVQLFTDLLGGLAVGQSQQNPRPLGEALRQRRHAQPALQGLGIGQRQNKRSCWPGHVRAQSMMKVRTV
ncbi:hypothetical protein D9M68_671570 [compost metagenome]